jgi:predicted nucleic acid-binding protein
MNASLDTNVIIHLYCTNLQSLLFDRFEKIQVHEFISNHELHNHASSEVLDKFEKDVGQNRIEIITDQYLKTIGMYNVFQQHVKEFQILFESGDLGEVYAIAIAKTLGAITLVTDDIKERGPHYTLMRIPDSDVMPLSFYELLFLDYLQGRISEVQALDNFNAVCSAAQLEMDCCSKLKIFIRRFWTSPYSDSEKEWMRKFCCENGINAREKLMKISTYLE